MDDSCSVVAALVGWVLWRLCHQQPDSPVAGSSAYCSGAEPFQEPNSGIGHREGQQMSEHQLESGPEAISRFRAVIVAALRVKQLRRGSKPRIEMADKKHKDTCIAMEEVRRGLISFTESALSDGHLKAGVNGGF